MCAECVNLCVHVCMQMMYLLSNSLRIVQLRLVDYELDRIKDPVRSRGRHADEH